MLAKRKLFLVDGSGYIFRAYYGISRMTRPDGTPINAVYGFTNMLMKLLKNNRSSHIAVVFDAARKTFRQDIYPEYKANRKETPEDLTPQFPLIRDAVKAFDIQCLEMEGFEADDLIATYAKLGVEKGIEVIIVSGDKDLMQLVGTGVTLIDPMKDKEITEEEVFKKFGVKPDKVIEVQALAGDSSDNIPGVPGIGPKTAAELINTYGTVENLISQADEIRQEKRRQSIKDNAPLALISKQLVTLRRDVDVSIPIDELGASYVNVEKVREFLLAQSFRSLLARLEDWGEVRNTNINKAKEPIRIYKTITDPKELKKFIDAAKEAGVVAFDTETTSLDQMQASMVGFSLCYEEGTACYIPLRHKTAKGQTSFDFADDQPSSQEKFEGQMPIKKALDILRPILEDEKVVKVGHNIKYDLHIMKNETPTIEVRNIEDTIVMAYILYGSRSGLSMDDLALKHLNHNTLKFSDVCGSGRNKITFDLAPIEKASEYAAEDADITLRLYNRFKPELEKQELSNVYEQLDKPLIRILLEMERAGVKIDEKQLIHASKKMIAEMEVLGDGIKELAGEDFNLNSASQLGEILFGKMGLKGGVKTKDGKWSTDAEILNRLAEEEENELAAKMLEYRELAKINSTYAQGLLEQINPKTLRVHTDYSQTITSTGRLSSNNPNLQNIPIRTELGRSIRNAFIAEEGSVLVSADYSQVELRLIAHIADVKKLKLSFLDGEDIHARTAAYVFHTPIDQINKEQRRNAKAINFGIIYGISAFGLARQLNITRKEAGEYINNYLGQYPEIKEYMENVKEEARAKGYVETFMGRRCFLHGINSPNYSVRGYAERAAINAPIQGGAADILKLAMIRLQKELGKNKSKAKIIMQVHDELVLEAPEKEAEETAGLLRAVMEGIVSLSIPLAVDVDIGKSWNT